MACRFSATSTFTQDINTLLCMCVGHLRDAIGSSLSPPDLCAAPLPPCLHLSGVPRSNYGRTAKMSEYTKSLNSSLNEKWKPNEKYYYFDLRAQQSFPSRSAASPAAFRRTGGTRKTEFLHSSLPCFSPPLLIPSDCLKLLLNSLFDFADMSP